MGTDGEDVSHPPTAPSHGGLLGQRRSTRSLSFMPQRVLKKTATVEPDDDQDEPMDNATPSMGSATSRTVSAILSAYRCPEKSDTDGECTGGTDSETVGKENSQTHPYDLLVPSGRRGAAGSSGGGQLASLRKQRQPLGLLSDTPYKSGEQPSAASAVKRPFMFRGVGTPAQQTGTAALLSHSGSQGRLTRPALSRSAQSEGCLTGRPAPAVLSPPTDSPLSTPPEQQGPGSTYGTPATSSTSTLQPSPLPAISEALPPRLAPARPPGQPADHPRESAPSRPPGEPASRTHQPAERPAPYRSQTDGRSLQPARQPASFQPQSVHRSHQPAEAPAPSRQQTGHPSHQPASEREPSRLQAGHRSSQCGDEAVPSQLKAARLGQLPEEPASSRLQPGQRSSQCAEETAPSQLKPARLAQPAGEPAVQRSSDYRLQQPSAVSSHYRPPVPQRQDVHNREASPQPKRPPLRHASEPQPADGPVRPARRECAVQTDSDRAAMPAPPPAAFVFGKRQLKTVTVNGNDHILVKQIGRGGSSKVYQVLDSEMRSLALKQVFLESADEATASGYMNEIQLLRTLQHSNRVVRLIDFEHKVDRSVLYIVMEQGDTDLASLLRTYTKLNEVDANMCKFFWGEMLRCVDVIHKEGIIHSDLKPSNFLLVAGRLKLIDFGIASQIQSDCTSIIKDTQVGTFNYMSPEAIQTQQVTRNGARQTAIKISRRSDVWSLGCILYTFVYGEPPFAKIQQVMGKLLAIIDPKHQIEFPPVENYHLLAALHSCLDRDPYKRATIDQLLTGPYLTGWK